MKHDHPSLRRMTPLDLPRCHELTKLLQWSHRLEDWAQAYRVSKGVVLELDGKVVGTAMAFLKGEQSSIGLITVDPDFQRRGFGRVLTTEVLRLATPNVSLVATDAGRALYESLGFKEDGVVRQYMRQPTVSAVHVDRRVGINVRRANSQDLPEIHRLGQNASTAFNKAIFDELLITANAVLVARNSAGVIGFCIVRPFGKGAVVGPVFAESTAVAIALVAESMNAMEDTLLRIDSNGVDEFDVALESLGFRGVSPAVRMHLGQSTETLSVHRQFSMASHALL